MSGQGDSRGEGGQGDRGQGDRWREGQSGGRGLETHALKACVRMIFAQAHY